MSPSPGTWGCVRNCCFACALVYLFFCGLETRCMWNVTTIETMPSRSRFFLPFGIASGVYSARIFKMWWARCTWCTYRAPCPAAKLLVFGSYLGKLYCSSDHLGGSTFGAPRCCAKYRCLYCAKCRCLHWKPDRRPVKDRSLLHARSFNT